MSACSQWGFLRLSSGPSAGCRPRGTSTRLVVLRLAPQHKLRQKEGLAGSHSHHPCHLAFFSAEFSARPLLSLQPPRGQVPFGPYQLCVRLVRCHAFHCAFRHADSRLLLRRQALLRLAVATVFNENDLPFDQYGTRVTARKKHPCRKLLGYTCHVTVCSFLALITNSILYLVLTFPRA